MENQEPGRVMPARNTAPTERQATLNLETHQPFDKNSMPSNFHPTSLICEVPYQNDKRKSTTFLNYYQL